MKVYNYCQAANVRPNQQQAERLAGINRQHISEQQEVIENSLKPYLAKIYELQKVIKNITTAKLLDCSESTTLIIDTETTGPNPDVDELLQVSIIDSNGNVLFSCYFKPCISSLKAAEYMCGMSSEMVQNAPIISDKITEINEIMCRADAIIGYNITSDLNFLRHSGLILSNNVQIIDVMELFAPIYGEWSDQYESYKWQKLTTAARYYGYNWNSCPEGTHNSLANCYATLYVYKKI